MLVYGKYECFAMQMLYVCILQSRSHTALQVTMSISFYLPHPAAVSAFIIYNGLCVCTEMW